MWCHRAVLWCHRAVLIAEHNKTAVAAAATACVCLFVWAGSGVRAAGVEPPPARSAVRCVVCVCLFVWVSACSCGQGASGGRGARRSVVAAARPECARRGKTSLRRRRGLRAGELWMGSGVRADAVCGL